MNVRARSLALLFHLCFGIVASRGIHNTGESLKLYSLATVTRGHDGISRLLSRQDAEAQLDDLPECTRTCFQQVLPQYGCSAGDSPCFCTNGNFTASLNACVGANCTLADSLPAQRFKAETCREPVRNRGGLSRRLNWAMFVIATLFVLCRFLSRTPALGGQGYGLDDWAVLFCYVLLVPTDVTAEIEVQNGLGMDMYMLSLDQVVKVLQMFYLGELFYSIIVMGTKISLVLLYLRIWTADSVTPAFRIACWTLVGVLASTACAGASAIIFQCSPVPYAWLAVTGELQGKCIKLEAFTYTYGALNISYDVIVFFLPVHSLLKLKITWPRKVGVIGAFLVGFLVTICSIVRLQYLVRLGDFKNISWDFQYVGMWSLVECNFSIVCCCMPAMAGLAQRIYASYCEAFLSGTDGSRGTQKDFDTNTTSSSQHRGPNHGRVMDVEVMARKRARHIQDDMEAAHENELGVVASFSGFDPGANTSTILYRDRPNAQNMVEISHEPPTRASRTMLRYRDQYDILHEVEIIDRPQGRIAGTFNRNSGVSGYVDLSQAKVYREPMPGPGPQWRRSEWEVCEEPASGEPSPRTQKLPDL